ncbi:hypothetical protein ABI59_06075 [Acidobacteria bacterium Mor1]|nr:hypothetical protein ABI59_06075 [Acidobacteria bacterium Mor1]
MDRQQVEQLHHQASEQYLSGDFAAAQVSWQQLLELNPQDERAREGVRLCGLLTQGDGAAAVQPDAPAAAPSAQATPPPVPEAPAVQVDSAAPADPATLVAEVSAADVGDLDFQLDFGETGSIPAVDPQGPPAAQTPPPIPAGADAQPQPASGAPVPIAMPEPDPEFVSGKLGLARAHLSAGRRRDAMAACHDVLHVDPANVEAQSLLDQADNVSAMDNEDFDDSLAVLDGPPSGASHRVQTEPGFRPSPNEIPTPDRQGEGIDIGDVEEIQSLDLAGEVPVDEPRRGRFEPDGDEPQTVWQGDAEPEVEAAQPAAANQPPAPAAPAAPAMATPDPANPNVDSIELDLDDPLGSMDAGDGGEPAPQVAGAMLDGRVHELLVEARAAIDEGRNDDALGTLTRVLILDETNQEALQLQGKIQSQSNALGQQLEEWITEGVQLFEHDAFEEAQERFKKVLEASPGHGEAEHYLEQIEQRLSLQAIQETDVSPERAATVGGGSETIEDLDDLEGGFVGNDAAAETPEDAMDAAAGSVPLTDTGEASTHDEDAEGSGLSLAEQLGAPPPEKPGVRQAKTLAKAKAKAPGKGGKLAKIALLAVLGIVALGAAAWFVLPMVGVTALQELAGIGGEQGEEPDALSQALERAAAKREAGSAEKGAAAAAVESAAATPDETALTPAAIATQHLVDARKAMSDGQYEAAIVSYNAVLSIDPDDAEARDGLLEAGKRYKAESETREQLQFARLAFEDGDFHSALRRLYRLPDTVDPGVVSRYKRNGWFNMSLVALKAGDPDKAIEYLNDAVALDAEDPDIKALFGFARKYQEQARDSIYYQTIEKLEFRAIDAP